MPVIVDEVAEKRVIYNAIVSKSIQISSVMSEQKMSKYLCNVPDGTRRTRIFIDPDSKKTMQVSDKEPDQHPSEEYQDVYERQEGLPATKWTAAM